VIVGYFGLFAEEVVCVQVKYTTSRRGETPCVMKFSHGTSSFDASHPSLKIPLDTLSTFMDFRSNVPSKDILLSKFTEGIAHSYA